MQGEPLDPTAEENATIGALNAEYQKLEAEYVRTEPADARYQPEGRIQQLREMEAHGIVSRTVFPQVPPRVDYEATPLSQSLRPVLLDLCKWGRRHAAELDELDSLGDGGKLSLPD